jgi:hypothetical protein
MDHPGRWLTWTTLLDCSFNSRARPFGVSCQANHALCTSPIGSCSYVRGVGSCSDASKLVLHNAAFSAAHEREDAVEHRPRRLEVGMLAICNVRTASASLCYAKIATTTGDRSPGTVACMSFEAGVVR